MKFIITSDWHLDAVTAGVERFDEVARAIEQTVKRATEVDDGNVVYLFLGDLADPSPPARSHRAAELAARVAHTLYTKGIDSLWLPGNHDVTEDGNGTTTLDAVGGGEGQVLKGPTRWSVGGIEIIALPFTPRSHAYDPAKAVRELGEQLAPGAPVLVLSHLNIEGFTPGSETTDLPRGREVILPAVEIEALRAKGHAVHVLNGHYHRSYEDPNGLSVVGALARLTFGEEDNQPRFLEVELREEGRGKKRRFVWHLEQHFVKSPVVLRTRVPGDDGFAASELAQVRGEIVRVRPTSTFAQDVSSCEEELRLAGALGVKVLPKPPSVAVVKPDETASEAPERRSHRRVIEGMVAEARSHDREALAALCGLVMDEDAVQPRCSIKRSTHQ